MPVISNGSIKSRRFDPDFFKLNSKANIIFQKLEKLIIHKKAVIMKKMSFPVLVRSFPEILRSFPEIFMSLSDDVRSLYIIFRDLSEDRVSTDNFFSGSCPCCVPHFMNPLCRAN